MNKEQLEKSIIATLAYYDILGLPLTGFEVYKYLTNVDNPISFYNVLDLLENNGLLQKHLGRKNGFYFLKGRVNIVWQRIKKEKIIQEKWKKRKSTIKLLAAVPFLRTVVLSGSMAVGNTGKDSDIDLLIIVKTGRIWTTRLLVTILLSILGARRHGKFIKDRICLNHYITDTSLKINFPSLYNAQTYVHLIPILGDAKMFTRFQKENSWVREKLPFYLSTSNGGNLKYLKSSLFLRVIAGLGELVLREKWGDFVERILAGWQRKVIGRKTDASGRGRITVDDTQLEFHPSSPEAWIIDKYNRKIEELGFPELAQEKDSGLK